MTTSIIDHTRGGFRFAAIAMALLVALVSAGLTAGLSPAVAHAGGVEATTSSERTAASPGSRGAERKRVIAKRHLTPRGGTVQARNGVAITVPPGVMRFPGAVTITDMGGDLYDFHIYAPWKGQVEIRLPKIDGRNVIMHEVRDGKWRIENARPDGPGFASAKVTSLSNFWNLLGCMKKLRPSSGAAVEVAKCLVGVGIDALPEWAGKQILNYFGAYDGCEFNVSSWSLDWVHIITTPCQTDAPSCERDGTCYPQSDPGVLGGANPGAEPGGGTGGGSSPSISLSRGGHATYGYWYSVWLTGFAPGSQVTLACHDSVDRSFWTQTFTIAGDGTAGDATLCYSGDGPDHWVTGGGVESNHVAW